MDRAWIRRLWTFQEIILATNPIVVCGREHIAWERLAFGVIFVSELAPYGRVELDPLLEVLSVWTRLIHTKVFYNQQQHPKANDSVLRELNVARLNNYRDFSIRLLNYHVATVGLSTMVCLWTCFVCLGCSIALLVLKLRLNRLESWPKAIPIVLLSVGVFVIVFLFTAAHIVPPLFLGRGYSVTSKEHRKHEVTTGEWVDAILTRSSFKPHDKAFGMHAIFQSLLGQELPTPDYEKHLTLIYRDLCLQIAECSRSLYHLLPASLDQRTDQPSWVTDWSKPLSETWRGLPYRRINRPAVWAYTVDNPNNLTTLAFRNGSIGTLYTMKAVPTSDPTDASLATLHNLKTMLDFAKLFSSYVQLEVFIRYLLERTDAMDGHPESIVRWAQAIYHIRHRSVSYAYKRYRYFYLWDIYSSVEATLGAITSAHVDFLQCTELICHHLHSQNIVLFRASVDGTSLLHVGFCLGSARVGDSIVDFVGGPCDFIIRGPWTAAKLISPATLMACHPVQSFHQFIRGKDNRTPSYINHRPEMVTLC